ncbi:hypothetical protein FDECE_15820 [Fusarium decemcellulare]|nr:hypothetical protein FDECE_15820 [Fusarium decemcellulare]
MIERKRPCSSESNERPNPNHALRPDTTLLFIEPRSNERKPKRRRHMGHVIAIEPLCESSPFLEPRRIKHEEINFELIRDWLAYCDKYHSEPCKSDKFIPSQDFRVINCENGEVVPAPADCKYAALSYVWGDIEHPGPNGCQKFPQVVMDSIKVAPKLGCAYLWVDRHCIDQEDPAKHKQIQRMDEIYSQAYVTIIDAAGIDCTSGLAGATSPRQPDPPQGYAQVDGVNLIYLGTPPAEKIRASRWASRGWTYQEGVLSHRRVFFTNEQVMFQCNTMTCLESYAIPMGALHTVDAPNKKKKPILQDTEPLFLIEKDLGRHLMEFSKRDLTYDRDSLDAFLGVLNVYRRAHEHVHFLGNPIHAKHGYMINAWHHLEPGTRRVSFPSWSWTGWKGAIKMTSRQSPDHELRLVTQAGCSISLMQYIKAYNTKFPPEMKPFIELKGKIGMLSFELIKWDSEPVIDRNRGVNEPKVQDGPWAILPLTTDITCYSFLYLDNESLTGLYQFKAPVIILEFGTRTRNHNTIILVLREKGDRYERVGLITSRDAFESDDTDWGVEAKPTVYKDGSGRWMTRAPTPEPKDRIWLQEFKEETIHFKSPRKVTSPKRNALPSPPATIEAKRIRKSANLPQRLLDFKRKAENYDVALLTYIPLSPAEYSSAYEQIDSAFNRFDYDPKRGLIILRMTSLTHDTFVYSLSRYIDQEIQRVGLDNGQLAKQYINYSEGNIKVVICVDINYGNTPSTLSLWKSQFNPDPESNDPNDYMLDYEQAIEAQPFRTADGKPLNPGSSLTLNLHDFAPDELCHDVPNIPIPISFAKICEFLDRAEKGQKDRESKDARGFRSTLKVRKRKVSSSSLEDLASDDEDRVKQQEIAADTRADHHDDDFVPRLGDVGVTYPDHDLRPRVAKRRA